MLAESASGVRGPSSCSAPTDNIRGILEQRLRRAQREFEEQVQSLQADVHCFVTSAVQRQSAELQTGCRRTHLPCVCIELHTSTAQVLPESVENPPSDSDTDVGSVSSGESELLQLGDAPFPGDAEWEAHVERSLLSFLEDYVAT